MADGATPSGDAFVAGDAPANAPDTRSIYRRSWAVLIGIDEYSKWPRLRYAVNDARGATEAARHGAVAVLDLRKHADAAQQGVGVGDRLGQLIECEVLRLRTRGELLQPQIDRVRAVVERRVVEADARVIAAGRDLQVIVEPERELQPLEIGDEIEQLAFVEGLGGRAILMASRALARAPSCAPPALPTRTWPAASGPPSPRSSRARGRRIRRRSSSAWGRG